MATSKIIAVKAFIHQPLGSSDFHMFEFDAENGGIERLHQEISALVDGCDISLAWLDQDGDRIRLSTDKQLKFAITHGMKDNVLRLHVFVDWLGLRRTRCSLRRKRKHQAAQSLEDSESLADVGETPAVADKDHLTNDRADAEGTDPEEGGEENQGEEKEDAQSEPVAKRKRTSCCPGNTEHSGYVRSVGPDGVTRQRDLSKEEVKHMLNHPSFLDFEDSHIFVKSAFFPLPRLEHPTPFSSHFFLTW